MSDNNRPLRENNDVNLSLPPSKKYKLWKENDAVPIPVRTLQRWDKNVCNKPNNINDDGTLQACNLATDSITEIIDDSKSDDGTDISTSDSDNSTDNDVDRLSDPNDSDQDISDCDNNINENNSGSDIDLEENIEDDHDDSKVNEETSTVMELLHKSMYQI
ncbi:Protein of unknown function [Cotesia congregata]|uniref:Uncharacterized protein n=1 Tax=Cotesia congregata TaxID=51543 RepID=A0A8J2HLA1_COTCN|nr:Protein of unknown function [Cotesia congregata]